MGANREQLSARLGSSLEPIRSYWWLGSGAEPIGSLRGGAGAEPIRSGEAGPWGALSGWRGFGAGQSEGVGGGQILGHSSWRRGPAGSQSAAAWDWRLDPVSVQSGGALCWGGIQSRTNQGRPVGSQSGVTVAWGRDLV